VNNGPEAEQEQRPARRRGPRGTGEDARADILAAARGEFAARGYDGATLRGIARAAGVDARLVHHYFDGKEGVFVAAMQLPLNPAQLVPLIVGPGPNGVGERVVRFFLGIGDDQAGRDRIRAVLSAVIASPEAAEMMRQFITSEVLGPIAVGLQADQPTLRATLAASHMVGLALLRYVVGVEPLASVPAEDLVRIVGGTLQRYLTGEL
jgi:AcrR family transcriptional regulator